MSLRDYKRSDRIAELIQPELAQLIQRRLNDPRLPGFISITAVKVSPDMRHARVYFTAVHRATHSELTEAERKTAANHLNAAASFLRVNLAKSLKMLRVIPTLFFVYDESIEHSRYLRQLIDTANAEEAVEEKNKDDDDSSAAAGAYEQQEFSEANSPQEDEAAPFVNENTTHVEPVDQNTDPENAEQIEKNNKSNKPSSQA